MKKNPCNQASAGAKPQRHWAAAQIICLSFVCVIAAGTLLLMLPVSHHGSLSLIDALFTATSATCVTGLIVADTYTKFTGIGQFIILLLIQIGGLGLVTLTSFFMLALRRKMGLRDMRLAGESVSADSFSQAASLLRSVILYALCFEAAGAVLLLFSFVPKYGAEGIWISIFLSISAFCNAGFDILGRIAPFASLTAYVSDAYVQTVIMLLIMAGGLGFIVWIELAALRKTHRLSLHSRLVLFFSAALWILGAAGFIALEWSNPATLGPLSVGDKLLNGMFQSVTTRTAGFNTVDLAACTPLCKVWMCALMFIGAAPGGTGGGVKITTFAVLLLTVISISRGRDECTVNEHRIDSKTVYRALSIFTIGLVTVFTATVILKFYSFAPAPALDCLFESVSAFATVGLSVGVTAAMTPLAKVVTMLVMFIGRVGPVSLAISLAARPDHSRGMVLPEAHINVG
jgi:trk system potassium uptake protein TrkH